MYNTHATFIAADVEGSPAAFRDVCLFVLATIQEPLERMEEAMASIRQHGADSPYLWGMKRQGYRDVMEKHGALYDEICALRDAGPGWEADAIVAIVDAIHGIGTAKAGFVLQLAFNVVGCLDSHNLKRFGLRKEAFNIAATIKRRRTKQAKARAYVEACHALGGCEFLWNSWCDHVASLRPEVWPTGEDVSAAHLVAVQPF